MGRRIGTMSPTAWITTEKVAQQLLWLGLFVILAPILGPTPYGLFSLCMVVVGFCELVLAEAVAEALLSLDEMTALHVGTANVCNLVAGVAAALLVIVIAEPMALIFHQATLAPMFLALSPLPILSSLGSSPTALLKREMKFRAFAVRSTLGLTLGGLLGVAAALMGAGVWALVLQVVAQRAAETTILWFAAASDNTFRWSWTCFSDLRACTRNVFLAKGLTWCAGQVPRVIIGLMLGPTVLGLFTLANRITDMILQTLVVPPTIVARLEMRRYAGDHQGLQEALDSFLKSVGFIAFPITVGLAAVIPPLFSLWLGHRWTGASLPTQLTILTILPWIYYYSATAVMMGIRRSGLDVITQAVLGITASLVTYLTAPFGLNAVCASLLIRLLILVALPLGLLWRAARLNPWSTIYAPSGPLAAALAMGLAVTALADWVIRPPASWLGLSLMIALGAMLYALVVLVLAPNEVRTFLRQYLRFGGLATQETGAA